MKFYTLGAVPNPTTTYEEAVARVKLMRERPTAGPLNPLAKTILLDYGRKVERSIVMLHGYTNCPEQFRRLGALFHAAGYNVLIPRMPHHGLLDRMTTDLNNLSAENLTIYADHAVDIATGLGDRVTVLGISTGGNLAGWLTHKRPDIEQIVIIAPALGLKVVPPKLTNSFIRLLFRLPNRFLWWGDPDEIDDGQSHAYPRYSTHALAHILFVGRAVRHAARNRKPYARDILVITNENDEGVNNEVADQVAAHWRRTGGFNVRTYTFKKDEQLDHDLIDPSHPDANIALVYPLVLKLTMNY